MPNKYTPTVLTIAGSDPYGGAGIQVDAKVIHALGGYAFCVTTALTSQNSTGVRNVWITPAEQLKKQLEAILDDIQIDAVKIGMLGNIENIMVIVGVIKKYKLKNIVLDTVMVSSSGKRLLELNAMDVLVKELFPLVDLITPNIPEVNLLLNSNYKGNADEIEDMAQKLFALGIKWLLIKGGHSEDKEAKDYLINKTLKSTRYSTKRIMTSHTHGTGCVLSSAIATNLAKGFDLSKSMAFSKEFIYKKLNTASEIRFKYISSDEIRKEPIL